MTVDDKAPPQYSPSTTQDAAGPARTRAGVRAWVGAVREVADLSRQWALLILLGFLILLFTLLTSDFLTASNWSDLLVTQSVTACVTFAVLGPLIVGEFDLSVGYALGFVSMLGAWVAGHGAGTVEVIVVMVGSGLVIGLFNGILTVDLGISSFIATLGVGTLLGGITEGLSGGEVLFSGIPSSILATGRDQVGGLAISVWLVLGVVLVLYYYYEHTPVGRKWYAIGGSERVALLAGVPTRRMKVSAFVLAGLLVSLGAIFELGSGGGANPSTGPEFLLPAYAAAFLGVTTYRAGRYNVVGTAIAILVLAVGFDGLSLLGVPYWGEPVFDGAVLLVAVLLARSEARQVKVG